MAHEAVFSPHSCESTPSVIVRCTTIFTCKRGVKGAYLRLSPQVLAKSIRVMLHTCTEPHEIVPRVSISRWFGSGRGRGHLENDMILSGRLLYVMAAHERNNIQNTHFVFVVCSTRDGNERLVMSICELRIMSTVTRGSVVYFCRVKMCLSFDKKNWKTGLRAHVSFFLLSPMYIIHLSKS